eukprot:TRINITY_DN12637_c0_g1_i1.p1 TRINITY_DN12637_c0_g1~~TRINITY_DN12637_c0_g1_i1.p1  ORF type:complete len:115 (+),score=15.60 TRINITY_DN12637_c0_g1_i1:296-640(+)
MPFVFNLGALHNHRPLIFSELAECGSSTHTASNPRQERAILAFKLIDAILLARSRQAAPVKHTSQQPNMAKSSEPLQHRFEISSKQTSSRIISCTECRTLRRNILMPTTPPSIE